MADKTGIEWTDATWNPTTGCDRVSPGCDNCYALTLAKRLKAMGSAAYQEDGDPRTSGPGFALQVHEDRLDQPLRWTKPRRIFVNSMSDLFHPRVPDAFIGDVFAVMAVAPRHTFQVLTKRPKRMRALLNGVGFKHAVDERIDSLLHARPLEDGDYWAWPLPNVWLGTSVEDQQRADERIPQLLDTPAAVRFLSCEPLLGPVDITRWVEECLTPGHHVDCPPDFATCRPGIGWVIVGGESGPGARPMHPQWARDLRDQVTAAGVPFLFKQWGAWAPCDKPDGRTPRWTIVPEYAHDKDGPFTNGYGMAEVGKHAAGRELDGRTWDEFPEAVIADA